ncbi:RING finger and SPRY domain-containing protein 1-like [Ctenocephalides felis]|uniref:RING finger and SPRY domain-containing protein 1-like n=1 Tax=Ctenocephalides felis TaxID=7515 RepID=UPI000E6E5275|nr:RING finger and SPRY domain-containing protein 1-like [Ctenocephalides felis]
MGTCFCKDRIEEREPYLAPRSRRATVCERNSKNILAEQVNKLVLDTLAMIGSIVDNEQDPPMAMVCLHSIADKEAGWIQVVESMVDVIPMDHPLGPSVITLLLDDCPLPSKDSVIKVSKLFDLSMSGGEDSARHRNICVILGCMAEKLAGPSSVAILSKDTLHYLINNLISSPDLHVILFSLIALEKFAQTSENKATIKKKLSSHPVNPLYKFEALCSSESCLERQVGFCARWCLDNLFVSNERKYSYETVDLTGIEVMLNTRDVSEYLKISPDGLEARCDSYSFESVRCTFQVDNGVWYYETLIITSGIMQIGWATKDSTFLNHEGYGIGDDEFSLAYDGCRRLVWHGARSHAVPDKPCINDSTNNTERSMSQWESGSILGCLLDLNKMEISFSLDGVEVVVCTQLFEHAKSGFFAAASFMSFQQCKFNFGSEPFKYPPTDRAFKSFNSIAKLNPEEKIVLPRHLYLEQLRKLSIHEDSCTLCFDKRATVTLHPCQHRGFCVDCSKLLLHCPMCRSMIYKSEQEEISS